MGSMDVYPRSTWERFFTEASLVLGLFLSSSVVSMLSANLTHMQMLKMEQTGQLIKLRRFLRQFALSKIIRGRVLMQISDRISEENRLTDRDVAALQLLSTQVRAELLYEIYK